VFVPSKLFQPSLMLLHTAGSLPSSGALEGASLGQSPRLPRKHYTRLDRPGRDKHSSLLRILVIYGGKTLYNIGSRPSDWPDFAYRGELTIAISNYQTDIVKILLELDEGTNVIKNFKTLIRELTK
jgi:hypothetical protein